MSAFERETSSKHKIQVDFGLPVVTNIQVVPEPQEELDSNIKLDHGS